MASKVLLVEDDNNLREIYEARLQAEGYEIVTARDGEEALGVAKAEVPDLVISDVMMPRVSGFEMLDILRNTDNLKDVKVIMLTALGQADDKTRANSLGADRYLVKSQVTLEDIVKAAHELLEGSAPQPVTPMPAAMPTTPALSVQPAPAAAAPAMVQPVQPAPTPMPSVQPAPAAMPASSPVSTPPVTAPLTVTPPVVAPQPAAPATPPMPAPGLPPLPGAAPAVPTMPAPMPTPAPITPVAPSTSEEKAVIGAQIDNFVQNTPDAVAPAAPTSDPAAQDDAVLADAVEDLAESAGAQPAAPANTPTMPQPEPAAPPAMPELPTPAPMPEMPASSPMSAPVAPADPATPPAPQSDNVVIANKKIIQPLNSPGPKPSIHELLAREEANNAAAMPATATTSFSPAAPTPTPTPEPMVGGNPAPAQPPVAPQQPQPTDFDPNNISL